MKQTAYRWDLRQENSQKKKKKMSNGALPLVNDAAKEIAYQLVIAVNTTFTVASKLYSYIPGGGIVYQYIKASHQNDPFRTLLEVFLVVFLLWYFVAKRYKPGTNEVKLTEQEVQELIEEWEPEPLVPELTAFQKEELAKTSVLTSGSGLKVRSLDGRERLNFASFNFLGIMNSDLIKEKAIAALRKYGVGTCGPPGFYGTLDIHMDLEARIAQFIGAEASIIYSQGFSAISSCIPAFSKRSDIIVADDGVSFSVQKGIQISRSHVKWFKHNDMEDLERVLRQVHTEFAKKPLSRRFIVAEGLYVNTGDICPLPQIIELKKKYKYRLILEESMSFGVLGPRGAGVADKFGVPASDIDILVASMTNSLGSSGGFCAGSMEIVEHQRLSGQAYTFSASLPSILAVAAIEALNFLENEPEILKHLETNAATAMTVFSKLNAGTVCTTSADESSPIIHLRLNIPGSHRENQDRILQEVVDLAFKDGILITRSKYVTNQELRIQPPSIRYTVSATFTKREVERSATVVREAIRRTLKQYHLI